MVVARLVLRRILHYLKLSYILAFSYGYCFFVFLDIIGELFWFFAKYCFDFMLVYRLTNYASGLTVGIMFLCIIWLQPIINDVSRGYRFWGVLSGVFLTYGLYRGIMLFLLFFYKKNLFLRKFVLGEMFVEGTWVGCYWKLDSWVITKEFIDQSTGEIIIYGREFYLDGATRASWVSDTVSIDLIKKQITYAYKCRVFARKNLQEGLGVFDMLKDQREKYASMFDGYSVDLIDGDRDQNKEYKVSDRNISDKAALDYAKDYLSIS